MSLLLFNLVKSMTISEKVHFKRNARTHSGKDNKNYLKIYNFIEEAEFFDKDTLADHFKGTTIEKYLSSEVNYLKEKILINLFNFNMNKTKRNKIQRGIILVESLAEKGFQKEALKKLKAIKKIAIKQEEFTWILRLIELEEILIFKEGILGYKAILEQLHQLRSETNEIIQNLNNYHIIRQEIREFQFSNKLLIDDLESLKEVRKNPLIETDKNCLSIRAKEHWLYIHVLINYISRDFSAGLAVSSDYVDFMSKNIHFFDENKILPALSNYIFHAALNVDKDHFSRGENLLIALSKRKKISSLYVKYILCTRNLEYAYCANDMLLMEKYLDLSIDLVENHSGEYENSQIQYLLMVIVRGAIVLKQHDKGMYYCNLWHQIGVMPIKNLSAKLFSIIIHFELGYLELIRSEVVLLKKLEKSHVRDKMLIRHFYNFINSILKYPERRNISIDTFQKGLKSISKNDKNYFSFMSFDYYQWSLGLS